MVTVKHANKNTISEAFMADSIQWAKTLDNSALGEGESYSSVCKIWGVDTNGGGSFSIPVSPDSSMDLLDNCIVGGKFIGIYRLKSDAKQIHIFESNDRGAHYTMHRAAIRPTSDDVISINRGKVFNGGSLLSLGCTSSKQPEDGIEVETIVVDPSSWKSFHAVNKIDSGVKRNTTVETGGVVLDSEKKGYVGIGGTTDKLLFLTSNNLFMMSSKILNTGYTNSGWQGTPDIAISSSDILYPRSCKYNKLDTYNTNFYRYDLRDGSIKNMSVRHYQRHTTAGELYVAVTPDNKFIASVVMGTYALVFKQQKATDANLFASIQTTKFGNNSIIKSDGKFFYNIYNKNNGPKDYIYISSDLSSWERADAPCIVKDADGWGDIGMVQVMGDDSTKRYIQLGRLVTAHVEDSSGNVIKELPMMKLPGSGSYITYNVDLPASTPKGSYTCKALNGSATISSPFNIGSKDFDVHIQAETNGSVVHNIIYGEDLDIKITADIDGPTLGKIRYEVGLYYWVAHSFYYVDNTEVVESASKTHTFSYTNTTKDNCGFYIVGVTYLGITKFAHVEVKGSKGLLSKRAPQESISLIAGSGEEEEVYVETYMSRLKESAPLEESLSYQLIKQSSGGTSATCSVGRNSLDTYAEWDRNSLSYSFSYSAMRTHLKIKCDNVSDSGDYILRISDTTGRSVEHSIHINTYTEAPSALNTSGTFYAKDVSANEGSFPIKIKSDDYDSTQVVVTPDNVYSVSDIDSSGHTTVTIDKSKTDGAYPDASVRVFYTGGNPYMWERRYKIVAYPDIRFLAAPDAVLYSKLHGSVPVEAVVAPSIKPVTFELRKGSQVLDTAHSTTGMYSYDIADDQVGDYTLKVTGDDGFGGSAETTFTIQSLSWDVEPVDISITEGQDLVINASAAGDHSNVNMILEKDGSPVSTTYGAKKSEFKYHIRGVDTSYSGQYTLKVETLEGSVEKNFSVDIQPQ